MAPTNKHFPDDKSGNLFNHLREKFKLPTDMALGKRINVPRYVISKIRTGKYIVSAQVKYSIHVSTGIPIKTIDKLIKGEK